MKKTKIIFWIITSLFSAFMLFAAIPDVMISAEAKTFMNGLGYPDYFTRLIGILKVLGVIAILVPGFPKIKEWAYAGLFFDLAGATYSIIAVGGFNLGVLFMAVILGFWLLSYIYFHKLLKGEKQTLVAA